MAEAPVWPAALPGGPAAGAPEQQRLLWLDLLDGVHVVVLTEEYRQVSPSPYCQRLSLYCPRWQLRGSLPVSFTTRPRGVVGPREAARWRAAALYFLPYLFRHTNSRPAWADSA